MALTVAGSDPSGGAGLQADLKTFQTLGVYGMSVVTVLTDCASAGVVRVHPAPPVFVARQLRRVCRDYPPSAMKTGMLYSRPIVEVVARHLRAAPALNFVFDPVITTRRGEQLVADDALAAMARLLLPRCVITTPSMPEAAALTGRSVSGRHDMEQAAERLIEMGAQSALVTGGHLGDDMAADFFLSRSGSARWLEAGRAPGRFHGAGDCLSAAIVAGLARGGPLDWAVEQAKHAVDRAATRAIANGRLQNNLVATLDGDFEPCPARR